MKTKRINGIKAKEVLSNVGSVYHLGGFETGKRINFFNSKLFIQNDLRDLNAGVDFAKDENCESLYAMEYINDVKVRFENKEGVHNEIWFDDSMKLYVYEAEKATYLISSFFRFVNVYRLTTKEPVATVVLTNYAGLVGDLESRMTMCKRMEYPGLESIKIEWSEYYDFVKVTGESEKVVKAFLGRGDKGYLKYALENDKEKKGTHVSKGIKYGISYQAEMNGRCAKCAAKGNCPKSRYGFLKCVEFSTVSGSFAYFVKPEVTEPAQPELAPIPLKSLEYGHKFLYNGQILFKGDSDNNGSFVCYDKYYMSGNEISLHGDVLVAPLEHEGDEYRPVFDLKDLTITQFDLIRDIMGNALNNAYWDKEEQVYVLEGLDMAISESEYNELKAVRYEY